MVSGWVPCGWYLPCDFPLRIEVMILLVSRILVANLHQVTVEVVLESVCAVTNVLVQRVRLVRVVVIINWHGAPIVILVIGYLGNSKFKLRFITLCISTIYNLEYGLNWSNPDDGSYSHSIQRWLNLQLFWKSWCKSTTPHQDIGGMTQKGKSKNVQMFTFLELSYVFVQLNYHLMKLSLKYLRLHPTIISLLGFLYQINRWFSNSLQVHNILMCILSTICYPASKIHWTCHYTLPC